MEWISKPSGSLESCLNYIDVVPQKTGLRGGRETARKRGVHTF